MRLSTEGDLAGAFTPGPGRPPAKVIRGPPVAIGWRTSAASEYTGRGIARRLPRVNLYTERTQCGAQPSQ